MLSQGRLFEHVYCLFSPILGYHTLVAPDNYNLHMCIMLEKHEFTMSS